MRPICSTVFTELPKKSAHDIRMVIAGIDGAKMGSWLALSQDTETDEIEAQTVWELVKYLTGPGSPEIVAIDIPIGLVSTGDRECDLATRELLRQRGCCVFPAPIRPVLKIVLEWPWRKVGLLIRITSLAN